MFPLKSLAPRRTFPVVTLGIIAVNVYVFLQEVVLSPPALDKLISIFGLVPARFTELMAGAHVSAADAIFPLITCMFLHADCLHIIGNMWFFWIFGATVEDRLGHIPFLLFYFICGIVAGLTHVAFNWGSRIPTIGASGAISGVIGAYLVLYPMARIFTLVPIVIIPLFFDIPALIFIGFWFVLQFLAGLGTVAPQDARPVAWWAHVGGFAMGMLLAVRWKRKRTPNYYYG